MARRKKHTWTSLDYHEGLSHNQVSIILREFGLIDKLNDFSKWLYGQTCPLIQRYNRHTGASEKEAGVYEYDLFRWIASVKKGAPLVWD